MGFVLPVKCSINLSFTLMSLGTTSETKRQKDSVNVFATTVQSIRLKASKYTPSSIPNQNCVLLTHIILDIN